MTGIQRTIQDIREQLRVAGPGQKAALQRRLNDLKYQQTLWDLFRAVPVDPVTRKLQASFQTVEADGRETPLCMRFVPGTPEADVLAWFEGRFHADVRKDFGYDGPWPGLDGCDGCAHKDKTPASFAGTACYDCRRCAYSTSRVPADRRPDRWEHAPDGHAAPQVRAVPGPCGDVEISVATPFAIRVPLSENDVFNWMTACADKDALLRLSRYAAKCASGLDAEPDDFRSRA